MLLLVACRDIVVRDDYGRVHAHVIGQVVSEQSAPMRDALLTFSVPITGNCQDTARLAPVTTYPKNVIRTDVDGRYSADLQLHAHSPRTYCVIVAVGEVTVRRAGVPFRDVRDASVDTVAIDVTVP